MRRYILTEAEKLLIVSLYAQKTNISQISKKIKRSHTTVDKFIKRYLARNSIQNRKPTGRRRKVSPALRSKIVSYVKKNRRCSVRQIIDNLGIKGVSIPTINRVLRAEKLASYKLTKKCKINTTQREERVKWAKDHQHYQEKDWDLWIFSDESFYTVGYCGGQRVRREPSETLDPDCIEGVEKWGTKIMFWGAINSKGVSNLIFLNGSMNSESYIEVLRTGLLPMYKMFNLDSQMYIFMEDGDPSHQSKMTKGWKKQNKINFIEDWPPNSPDLNPIENIWAILKKRVGIRNPRDVATAKRYLKEEWFKLEEDNFLSKFIYSMPKRCSEVIRSEGHPIKY